MRDGKDCTAAREPGEVVMIAERHPIDGYGYGLKDWGPLRDV